MNALNKLFFAFGTFFLLGLGGFAAKAEETGMASGLYQSSSVASEADTEAVEASALQLTPTLMSEVLDIKERFEAEGIMRNLNTWEKAFKAAQKDGVTPTDAPQVVQVRWNAVSASGETEGVVISYGVGLENKDGLWFYIPQPDSKRGYIFTVRETE